MLLRKSAHIKGLSEADALLDPQDEKCKELIRLFILTEYKGIVIKSWSARPIACFVRGNEHARVELLARYVSTRSQDWGTTFGMLRCFFGTEIGCIDLECDTPTFDCLATTGSRMTKEKLKDYVGQRLPPRNAIQTYGRNKEIVVIQIDQSYDSRHILRAGLPYATAGVFHHSWSSKSGFSEWNHATCYDLPMRRNH